MKNKLTVIAAACVGLGVGFGISTYAASPAGLTYVASANAGVGSQASQSDTLVTGSFGPAKVQFTLDRPAHLWFETRILAKTADPGAYNVSLYLDGRIVDVVAVVDGDQFNNANTTSQMQDPATGRPLVVGSGRHTAALLASGDSTLSFSGCALAIYRA